jgi:putative ABC transport system substrate-binding protein
MRPGMARHTRRELLQGSLAFVSLSFLGGCGLPSPPWRATAPPPRVAVVNGRSEGDAGPQSEAFRQGLREHGYEEGRNIAIDWRFLDGRVEQSPDVVRELLSLGVTAIVTGNPQFAQAAKQATGTVPIILAGVFNDPVAIGMVGSLQRPGGNVTGLSFSVPTLNEKRLELLTEVVPDAVRLGALWDATLGPAFAPRVQLLHGAATALKVRLLDYWISDPGGLQAAFAAMRQDAVGGLHVTETALTLTLAGDIAELALRQRLPVMFAIPEAMRRGGILMALGADPNDLYRRAAGYLHKVLQGTDPAELPIEQPTKFEFVINLRTAQALGLSIPPSVLQQGTEIIQ